MPLPAQSLVKYDNPVLLTDAKKKTAARKAKAVKATDVAASVGGAVPQTEDILNSILPPREFEEDGQKWVQFVSSTPATRLDVLNLQVTVNCAERGLLLLRVRDEARMTLAAYRTLYESSVAFGMRKALQAEQTKVDLQASIRNLEREKEELERQVQELNTKCEAIERREADRRSADEKKHAEEVALYRKTHQTLTSQLQAIINPSKK
jgi:dynein light intermediate chain